MRIALLGDIHGNLVALDEVLDFIKEWNVEKIVCLGDIVGYGADPSACLTKIRQRASLCVAGNHDAAASGSTNAENFNRDAKAAVRWTAAQLSEEERAYLKALPLMVVTDFGTIVHATPDAPELWHYIYTDLDAMLCFDVIQTKICFVAHSHVPIIYASGDPIGYTRKPKVKLSRGRKYIINVGSVGQPRDGDSRSCFVVFDDQSLIVETLRIPYDIERSQGRILEAGLPDSLAYRLAFGQ